MIAKLTPAHRQRICLVSRKDGKPMSHPFEYSFMMPQPFDYDTYPLWKDNGGKDLDQRARDRARQILADYERPPLDEAIREELDAFVKRRKREIST
ncbi:trimethylamine methyltransferase family protein [Agrobacterium tumefaciens]|nr:trimethylamine methyltransferase family protein [Agrobacterium tumefaciens]